MRVDELEHRYNIIILTLNFHRRKAIVIYHEDPVSLKKKPKAGLG